MGKKSVSGWFAWLTIGLSAMVLAGWQLDIEILRSGLPGAPPTTRLTAIILLFLGIALLVSRSNPSGRYGRDRSVLCMLFAAIPVCIAAGVGARYLFSSATLNTTIGAIAQVFQEPRWPSPHTVISTLFIGTAVALSCFSGVVTRRVVVILVAIGLIIPWFALFGYVSATSLLYAMSGDRLTGMSPLTAAAFLAILTGVVALRPGEGLAGLLREPSSGGKVVRRLLPAAIISPLALGWVLFYGRSIGLFDWSVGFALGWGCTSLLMSALIVWGGFVFRRYDRKVRETAEERDRMLVELGQAHEWITQQAAELERSNKELQQFAYVASHDLQAPLRSIGGFTELLQTEYGSSLGVQARGWMGRIADSTGQMQELIRDLLSYASVGAASLEDEPTNLGEVLDDVLKQLSPEIREAQGEVIRGNLPTVTADRSQIAQLFQNLIGNSVKYRGHEPLCVTVDSSAENGSWVISVRDNGIGIDCRHHARIFEPFRRLHSAHEYPGTGIGLAISQRVVQRHGGKIWVESAPGKGSTFFFTIPAKTRPESNDI